MAQSGGLGFGIMNQGLARGIDFSYVISTGNETDLGVAEYAEYLVADEHTQVIGLFLEGLDEPLRLRDLALRAAAAGKAIVAAKVGRSPEAQQAAVSHTGHIAGPSRLWSALFRQAGIVEVTDIAEFLDVLAVLARFRAAGGNRAAVITVSGGAGTWMTDALRQFNVEVPELAASIQDQLRPLLPYYAGTRNPVDITAGAGGPEVVARILSLAGGSDDIDIVVMITSLMNSELGKENAERLGQAARELGKPVIVYSYTQPADGVPDAFAEQGLPGLLSQAGVARASRILADLPLRSTALSHQSRAARPHLCPRPTRNRPYCTRRKWRPGWPSAVFRYRPPACHRPCRRGRGQRVDRLSGRAQGASGRAAAQERARRARAGPPSAADVRSAYRESPATPTRWSARRTWPGSWSRRWSRRASRCSSGSRGTRPWVFS